MRRATDIKTLIFGGWEAEEVGTIGVGGAIQRHGNGQGCRAGRRVIVAGFTDLCQASRNENRTRGNAVAAGGADFVTARRDGGVERNFEFRPIDVAGFDAGVAEMDLFRVVEIGAFESEFELRTDTTAGRKHGIEPGRRKLSGGGKNVENRQRSQTPAENPGAPATLPAFRL